MAWVKSLAWELPHKQDMAKKKRTAFRALSIKSYFTHILAEILKTGGNECRMAATDTLLSITKLSKEQRDFMNLP